MNRPSTDKNHAQGEFGLLGPRYWPMLFLLAIIRILSVLPLWIIELLAAGLTPIMRLVGRRRIDVADTNIKIAFPDKSDEWRLGIRNRNMRIFSRGVLATLKFSFADRKSLEKSVEFIGEEILDREMKKGKGIILLSPHFVDLHIGAFYLASRYPLLAMYKKPVNLAVHTVYRAATGQIDPSSSLAARFFASSDRDKLNLVEHREGLRPVIRWLRNGGAFYYLPDQDLGNRHAIFAPFFGIKAVTVSATWRFARTTGASVLPCVTICDRPGHYRLEIHDPVKNDFENEFEYATGINRIIESSIKDYPAHYFWLHKRFKTRPRGESPIY